MNILFELLARTTPREQEFLKNFFMSNIEDFDTARLNYINDLLIYKYPHSLELFMLFDFFYEQPTELITFMDETLTEEEKQMFELSNLYTQH